MNMTHTIQLPIRNVSCEACTVVIGRILEKFPHAKVENISSDARTLTITCDEKDVHDIKEKLREYNYLNEERGGKEHVWFVLNKIIHNQKGFEGEHEILKQTIGIAAILVAVLAGLYYTIIPATPYAERALPILALIPIGIALNAGVLAHVKQVRTHFTCANGMMTGMIIGMISGFLAGAVLGATNGMFVGSLGGMAIGMGVSAWALRSNGIMSVLEGLMAGLMSGTMGAMLSIMMLLDHLLEFLYILFGVGGVILLGMSYYMIKEVGPIQSEKRVPFITLAGWSVVLLLAIVAIIFWGPKSSFVWGGFA
jgi:cation transport ATPase